MNNIDCLKELLKIQKLFDDMKYGMAIHSLDVLIYNIEKESEEKDNG